MTKKAFLISFLISIIFIGYTAAQNVDFIPTTNGKIEIKPIYHGSLVLTYNNKTVYIDPYGGASLYKNIKSPDIILITDIHGDHLNEKTLDSIDTSKSIIIAPQAVADKISEKYKSKITILNNGQSIHRLGFYISAIPMYNLPEEPKSKHPKGRGNGYLINVAEKQIYISGDTEDIAEMRMLKNIDVAFICMNLPFTMDIYQAADAVLEFKPKIVYPFHYRGSNGFSNVNEFKEIVNSKNATIEVRLRNWYN